MRPISLTDFLQKSYQRVDSWFRDASIALYGDAFSLTQTASTGQSIPSGVTTKTLGWNVTEYNSGCLSSNRFVATTPGFYFFDCQLWWFTTAMPGQVFRTMLYKNGAEMMRHDYNAEVGVPINTLSTNLLLSKDDFVEIYVFQNTGSNVSLWDAAGGSARIRQRWSGFLVRPV